MDRRSCCMWQAQLEGVRLLLLNNPLPQTMQELQAGEERRPVFLALGAATGEAMEQSRLGKAAAAGMLFLSTLTTLGFGLSTFLLTNDVEFRGRLLEQMRAGDAAPLELALPIGMGIGGLQVLHELAHFVQVRDTPPVATV